MENLFGCICCSVLGVLLCYVHPRWIHFFSVKVSVANSFNLQELLNILIQFGFGVSEQCRSAAELGVFEKIWSHMCVLGDSCCIFAGQPGVDRSETITSWFPFFFFFWEMFEKQFWSVLSYLCLWQTQPAQYEDSLYPL